MGQLLTSDDGKYRRADGQNAQEIAQRLQSGIEGKNQFRRTAAGESFYETAAEISDAIDDRNQRGKEQQNINDEFIPAHGKSGLHEIHRIIWVRLVIRVRLLIVGIGLIVGIWLLVKRIGLLVRGLLVIGIRLLIRRLLVIRVVVSRGIHPGTAIGAKSRGGVTEIAAAVCTKHVQCLLF